jgi:type I restriction enzyme R subunit
MLDKYEPIERRSGESETEAFERIMKKRFVNEPGRMQLLIVVDKLLTGFDTPPTTFLYLDKNMQDHGLFQAVCRVNRLHGDDKDYGYIVDYRDLFKELEEAVKDYTSGAFSGFEKEDVVGLLKDQLSEGKKDLDQALDTVRALCEPVQPPKEHADYIQYFCGDTENPYALKDNQAKRVELYKAVGKLLRAYASIANELIEAGYTQEQASAIKKDVEHFEAVRQEVRLASGDHINLKKYEPAMRSLLDRYISAGESEQLTTFDDKPLIDLLAERGVEGLKDLPSSIKNNQENVAETIENNIRKLITEERPTNPQYYKQMSELLTELVKKRKQADLDYQKYLEQIMDLAKKVRDPSQSEHYPAAIDTKAKQAIFDNLEKDEEKALKIHQAVLESRRDGFREHLLKRRLIKNAIREAVDIDDNQLEELFEIIQNQDEY